MAGFREISPPGTRHPAKNALSGRFHPCTNSHESAFDRFILPFQRAKSAADNFGFTTMFMCVSVEVMPLNPIVARPAII